MEEILVSPSPHTRISTLYRHVKQNLFQDYQIGHFSPDRQFGILVSLLSELVVDANPSHVSTSILTKIWLRIELCLCNLDDERRNYGPDTIYIVFLPNTDLGLEKKIA